LVAAEVAAIAETDFSSSVNKTSLHFRTGASETATTKLQIMSDGRGLSQFTAKNWINYKGTDTVSVRDSHNVSSVTDNGTGNYTINYTNNYANANYVAVPWANWDNSSLGVNTDTYSKEVDSVNVRSWYDYGNTNPVAVDAVAIGIVGFGD